MVIKESQLRNIIRDILSETFIQDNSEMPDSVVGGMEEETDPNGDGEAQQLIERARNIDGYSLFVIEPVPNNKSYFKTPSIINRYGNTKEFYKEAIEKCILSIVKSGFDFRFKDFSNTEKLIFIDDIETSDVQDMVVKNCPESVVYMIWERNPEMRGQLSFKLADGTETRAVTMLDLQEDETLVPQLKEFMGKNAQTLTVRDRSEGKTAKGETNNIVTKMLVKVLHKESNLLDLVQTIYPENYLEVLKSMDLKRFEY